MVPVSTAADCKAIVEVFDRTTTDGIRLEDHALLEAVSFSTSCLVLRYARLGINT
jgi:hypothetical protein